MQALKKVPQVNASWRGDFIREFKDVNIGVAVQTDVGLLVPVLPNADGKGLGDISQGVKTLATKVHPYPRFLCVFLFQFISKNTQRC